MHRFRTCGRLIRSKTAVLLVMGAALLLAVIASRDVEALQFPVRSLDELSARADVVFVGTVTGRTEVGEAERLYTFRVDVPLKGGLDRKSEMTARVPQDGDGGVLGKGATYLVLLRKTADGGHAAVEGRQGFVRLKNGRAESRYFSREEVDRYLARYGLEVKTIYERFVPQDAPSSRRHTVREATDPAVLRAGSLALAALLAWLFARAIRQRRSRI